MNLANSMLVSPIVGESVRALAKPKYNPSISTNSDDSTNDKSLRVSKLLIQCAKGILMVTVENDTSCRCSWVDESIKIKVQSMGQFPNMEACLELLGCSSIPQVQATCPLPH